MTTPSRFEGDAYFTGSVSAKEVVLSPGSVTNAKVGAGAGIVATKLEHQYEKGYAQESDTVSTDEARPIHAVYGATGTVIAFQVGSIVPPNGAGAEVTVDLLKNGTTILTSAVVLTTSHTARQVVAGVIGTTALVVGDVLEIDIVAGTAGTAAKGVFASLIHREVAQ